jgi:uncharacterized Ntn-hydrolase superfamily protein
VTWSLIARDASGAFGIAVATKNFAVGCRVPHIESGIGVVATQALSKPVLWRERHQAAARRQVRG